MGVTKFLLLDCIAISLATAFPKSQIVGVDLDEFSIQSAEAVAAMKDLYRLAESEQGIRESLARETASNYEISDTDERLSAF